MIARHPAMGGERHRAEGDRGGQRTEEHGARCAALQELGEIVKTIALGGPATPSLARRGGAAAGRSGVGRAAGDLLSGPAEWQPRRQIDGQGLPVGRPVEPEVYTRKAIASRPVAELGSSLMSCVA